MNGNNCDFEKINEILGYPLERYRFVYVLKCYNDNVDEAYYYVGHTPYLVEHVWERYVCKNSSLGKKYKNIDLVFFSFFNNIDKNNLLLLKEVHNLTKRSQEYLKSFERSLSAKEKDFFKKCSKEISELYSKETYRKRSNEKKQFEIKKIVELKKALPNITQNEICKIIKISRGTLQKRIKADEWKKTFSF